MEFWVQTFLIIYPTLSLSNIKIKVLLNLYTSCVLNMSACEPDLSRDLNSNPSPTCSCHVSTAIFPSRIIREHLKFSISHIWNHFIWVSYYPLIQCGAPNCITFTQIPSTLSSIIAHLRSLHAPIVSAMGIGVPNKVKINVEKFKGYWVYKLHGNKPYGILSLKSDES